MFVLLLTNFNFMLIILIDTNEKGETKMEDIISLISNYGIGVACVGYLIYFQNTTMKSMLETLNGINTRLAIIEEKLETKNRKKRKEEKENEA